MARQAYNLRQHAPQLSETSQNIYSYLVKATTNIHHDGASIRFHGRLTKKNGEVRELPIIVSNTINQPDLVNLVQQAVSKGETRMLVSFERETFDAGENLSRIAVVGRIQEIPSPSKAAVAAAAQLSLAF